MPDFNIDRAEQLRYLGYQGQELTEELLTRLDAMAELCLRTAAPKYCWRLYALPELEDALEGEDIRAHLRGAAKCAVLAVTLGFSVERELLRLQVSAVTDALLYNAACTCLVESAADRCEAEIIRAAKKEGFEPSRRFSPGYGDYPLEKQREVLPLSGGDRLGITLTEDCLMVPRKSVTALLPLFPRGTAIPRTRTCERCSNRDSCEYRKAGVLCGG